MGAQCPLEPYQSHEIKSTGTGMMGEVATGPTTVSFKPRAEVSQLATHSSQVPPTDSSAPPKPHTHC